MRVVSGDIPWLIILLAVLALILAWEVYALVSGRTTLSRWVAGVSIEWPILPLVFCFAVGVLVGHFFWPQCLD